MNQTERQSMLDFDAGFRKGLDKARWLATAGAHGTDYGGYKVTDNQADGFKSEVSASVDEGERCPNCGSQGARRWKLLSGQDVCSECWSDFQDVPALLREPPSVPMSQKLRPRGGAKSGQRVLTPSRPGANAATTGVSAHWHSGGSRAQLPHRELPQRPRLNGCDELKVGYNSCCIMCGHIFYGVKMKECTRCGGAVQHRTDHDLGLMIRNPARLIEGD